MLQIRNLPDDLKERLRARRALGHRLRGAVALAPEIIDAPGTAIPVENARVI